MEKIYQYGSALFWTVYKPILAILIGALIIYGIVKLIKK